MTSDTVLGAAGIAALALFVVFRLRRAFRDYEHHSRLIDSLSPFQVRLRFGLGVIGLGVFLLGLSQYEVHHNHGYHRVAVLLGPLILALGFARLLAGKSTVLNWLLGVPAAVVGGWAGFNYLTAIHDGVPNPVSKLIAETIDPVLGRMHLLKREVSLGELEAALGEIRAQAAELTRRKAQTSPSDKPAMEALTRDIEAYNLRNHEVAELNSAFLAKAQKANDLKRQVAGTWVAVTDFNGGLTKTTTTRYREDGTLQLEVNLSTSESAVINGRWELHGSKLIIHCGASSNPQVATTNSEQSFVVERVDDSELHLLAEDGEKIVKQRVK